MYYRKFSYTKVDVHIHQQVCEDAVEKDIIGGPGGVLEIDESHFCTVKQEQGRKKEKSSNCIFGGIERQSKKFFAVTLGLEGNRIEE